MSAKYRIAGSELRRSLNLIILAITFGMAFFTVYTGPALTGFTRSLGAGDLVYAVIMAMPVVGGVVQVFASYFLENTGKRKPIFIFFGFIHRLFWIPIALVPLLFPASLNTIRIWSVTLLITISSVANSITSVAFTSWMGSLVPMDIRGRFFSKRTMISTITCALTALGVGKFLDLVPGFNGYAIVFIVVALLGSVDIVCFIWIKDPPMELPEEKIPFFKLFTQPYGNPNYMRFILFVSVFNFGVNFAGPFFNVYMLEHLKMDFFIISLFTQFISNISTIIFIRYWGRLADKYGNKPVMAACCTLIIILPFLWLFVTPQNYFIILFINFLGGALWPGYDMTAMNLSIWLAPEKNRSIYVANYTLIISLIGIATAYVCGGAFMEFSRDLVNHLNIPLFNFKIDSFKILFASSGLIRLIAVSFLLKGFKEDHSLPVSTMAGDIRRNIKARLKM